MDELFLLKPEVAGEIGKRSKLEYKNGMVSKVKFLHYEFFGWLGDELLKQSPGCFIVTESLANDIKNAGLTGFDFDKVLITKSDEFKEMYPKTSLPKFVRLIPSGTVEVQDDKVINWSGHDINLRKGLNLVLTKKALDVFCKHQISHCDIGTLAF